MKRRFERGRTCPGGNVPFARSSREFLSVRARARARGAMPKLGEQRLGGDDDD
jgi:hypothetical protein